MKRGVLTNTWLRNFFLQIKINYFEKPLARVQLVIRKVLVRLDLFQLLIYQLSSNGHVGQVV